LWAHGIDFLLKSIWETWVKGGTTGKDDVSVEILSDIDVALLDGGESHLVETFNFGSLLDLVWEEESFWTHESWCVDVDDLAIWELVLLLVLIGVGGLLLGFCWVEGDETEFLLDFSYDLLPG